MSESRLTSTAGQRGRQDHRAARVGAVEQLVVAVLPELTTRRPVFDWLSRMWLPS